MNNYFIKRDILFKIDGVFHKSRITISRPLVNKIGFYECKIKFSNIKKYNTISKGVDEINSVDCAISYVNSVCENSEDPEFFFSEDESMRIVSG